ncbi:MAG: hypothetical protein J07HQW2_00523 [Haloquadratum walsbyi J07HQW2]|uniref:Uncharacterized protein n=1 Tax=Haloquadratum walsbyi J07HQW2 TaxID=1238425 RepID=U1MUQ3_9EURY|nr:MAG: hypothetical protein J07HQW2_00523 [Haloquadratum walsbyi J07HQW2]
MAVVIGYASGHSDGVLSSVLSMIPIDWQIISVIISDATTLSRLCWDHQLGEVAEEQNKNTNKVTTVMRQSGHRSSRRWTFFEAKRCAESE